MPLAKDEDENKYEDEYEEEDENEEEEEEEDEYEDEVREALQRVSMFRIDRETFSISSEGRKYFRPSGICQLYHGKSSNEDYVDVESFHTRMTLHLFTRKNRPELDISKSSIKLLLLA